MSVERSGTLITYADWFFVLFFEYPKPFDLSICGSFDFPNLDFIFSVRYLDSGSSVLKVKKSKSAFEFISFFLKNVKARYACEAQRNTHYLRRLVLCIVLRIAKIVRSVDLRFFRFSESGFRF